MAPKKAAKAKAAAAAAAIAELGESVANLADNVNDDFAIKLSSAIETIKGDPAFQDIVTAKPIGISHAAGVAESAAGSQAGPGIVNLCALFTAMVIADE